MLKLLLWLQWTNFILNFHGKFERKKWANINNALLFYPFIFLSKIYIKDSIKIETIIKIWTFFEKLFVSGNQKIINVLYRREICEIEKNKMKNVALHLKFNFWEINFSQNFIIKCSNKFIYCICIEF